MAWREVVLLPGKGRSLLPRRIGFVRLMIIVLTIGAGMGGYFIPFHGLTIDVLEQNQRRNLAKQNVDLLKKICAIRGTIGEVLDQIDSLDNIHASIDSLLQFDKIHAGRQAHHRQKNNAVVATKDPLTQMNRIEESIERIVHAVENNPDFFSSLPLSYPLASPSQVVLGFGKARDPFTGEVKKHDGIDLVAPSGSIVMATASGTVSGVDRTPHWGLRVRIKHAYGFSTIYAHLGSVCVVGGQRVHRGTPVGTLGASGITTGPHLHYEIRQNGVAIDPQFLLYPTSDSPLVVSRFGSNDRSIERR